MRIQLFALLVASINFRAPAASRVPNATMKRSGNTGN